MRRLVLLGALLGCGFAPWLLFSAIDRIASLPAYDHVADKGKIPVIGSTGIVWSSATGVTGIVLTSGAVVAGDIVNWSDATHLVDSGIASSTVARGTVGATAATNDLAAFSNAGGRQLSDSGIPLANVVLVSRAVQAGTGLSVTNSGLLSADITLSSNYGVGSTNATVGNDARLAPTTWATSNEPINASFLPSVASNALTIALKQADNTDPTSATNKSVQVPFRLIAASSANYSYASMTAATGLTVPSGATLGMASAVTGSLYVYAVRDSATAIAVGIAGNMIDEGTLQSPTKISASATSPTILYAPTGYTNVPVRLLGRLQVVETTAGLWASAPFEAAPPNFAIPIDLPGVASTNNAPSGYKGEWCGGSRGHASQLSLTSNTATNIVAAGCPLTAGDWEIRGAVNFSATNATTSITDFNIGISATSGALPSANTIGSPISGEYRARWGILPAYVPGSSNNDDFTINVPPYRVTVATGSTTTLYLIGFATFTVSTLAANGWFEARRIR